MTRRPKRKAQQLTQAFQRAGLTALHPDIIVRSLGNDGGAVCDNPANALGRATLLDQMTNGADFVGRRPIIVDSRILVGEALILQTYCPEKLQEFKDKVDDIEDRRRDRGLSGERRKGDDMPTDELRAAVKGLMPQAKRDLAELVAFKSVADPAQFRRRSARRPPTGSSRRCGRTASRTWRCWTPRTAPSCVHGFRPGPPGAPTVLLYAHYDVQPPLDDRPPGKSPLFELTERDGRWYGRGAADCKGDIVMHLTALRALEEVNGDLPFTVKVIVRGLRGTGHRRARARTSEPRGPAARRRNPRGRHRQLPGRAADGDRDAARDDARTGPGRHPGGQSALRAVRAVWPPTRWPR